MILRIEDLKEVCSKILFSVDTSDLSTITETVELEAIANILYLRVTNREYFVEVKLDTDCNETFNATVNAALFLKLVSQITTDTVEMKCNEKNLIVVGNGAYKIPLIYDNDELLKLPRIEISNVTSSMTIDSSILNSILTFNSKELNKGAATHPVQRLFYLDDEGCITFTSGACVNKFKLEKSAKILLSQKVVKLFKLFKEGPVNFNLGFDSLPNGTIQTKLKLFNNNISVSAILANDDNLISKVPVQAIRDKAYKEYNHSVVINKNELLQIINRLLLFKDNQGIAASKFIFSKSFVTIYDSNDNNFENLYYENDDDLDIDYNCDLDLVDLKTTIESFSEQYVNINFGDSQAIVIARGNIYNVIPEITR